MIIAVTDRKNSAKRDFFEQIESIAAGHPDMIILREKDLPEQQYRYLAIECARICGSYSVDLCINTFIKTARRINNRRVQIPFAALAADPQAVNGFDELWVSVHSLDEAVRAERLGATHLIYGNIFETSSKPGAEGRGTEELGMMCRNVGIPVFAIGGIRPDNLGPAIRAGCKGVCVRGLTMRSTDPRKTIDELRASIADAEL